MMTALIYTLTFASMIFSSPESINLQGRLFDANGEVIDGGVVPIILEVRDPSGQCLLYEEEHSIDMTGRDGLFAVALGEGTKNTSTAPNFSLKESFSNVEIFADPHMNCTGNNYSPGATDSRRIRVTIDGSVLSPDQIVRSQPYAISAGSLNGFDESDFIRNDGANITQTKLLDFFSATDLLTTGESLRWDGSAWEVFTPGSASAVTAVSSANSYLSVVNGTTSPELTINVGTGADTLAAGNDSRFPSLGCVSGSFMRWDGSDWQCEADSDTTYSASSIMTAIQSLDSDSSGLNADTLDSQQGSYFLDYGNFTNTPTIPDGYSLNSADSSATDVLFVDNLGKVGIGTTSPSRLLTLEGNQNGLRIQSSSGPTSYYTELINNYNASEPYHLSLAGEKQIGKKEFVSSSSYAETYLASNYGLALATGTADPTSPDVRLFVTESGNVGVGTVSPKSILEVNSTTSGFLPPRMTSGQRDLIASPDSGSLIFNTTVNYLEIYNGVAWSPAGLSLPNGAIMSFASTSCPAGWVDYAAGAGRFIVGVGTAGSETYNLNDIGGAAFHALTESELPAHDHSVDPPEATTSTDGDHTHEADPPNTSTNNSGSHDHDVQLGNGSGNHNSNQVKIVSEEGSGGGSGLSRKLNGGPTNFNPLDSQPAGSHSHSVNIPSFDTSSAGAHSHTVNIPSFDSGSSGSGEAHENRPPYVALRYCQYQGGTANLVPPSIEALDNVNISSLGNGHALVYNSSSGEWENQDVSTSLGYDPVNRAGDTMTGALNLPANGIAVGTNQLVVSGGHVGIGVASPTESLEVSGNIKMGWEAASPGPPSTGNGLWSAWTQACSTSTKRPLSATCWDSNNIRPVPIQFDASGNVRAYNPSGSTATFACTVVCANIR